MLLRDSDIIYCDIKYNLYKETNEKLNVQMAAFDVKCTLLFLNREYDSFYISN